MGSRLLARRASLALALVGALLSFAPGAAQVTQPRPPERGADLLSLQFAAVLPDGSPVGDLRADEVKVRMGGSERAVRSLQLIVRDVPTPGAVEAPTVPPPFGTNASSTSGRTIVLAIDEDSLRPGLQGTLRQATDALIAGLAPSDAVSLVTLPFGGVKVPFTTDRPRLRLALSQVVGQASSTQTGSEMACRTRRMLEALVGYFEGLGIREEPITVAFITAAVAAPRRDANSALAPGMCELLESLFVRVATAAGAAKAQFYVIRPGDASDGGAIRDTSSGSDNPLAGIDHLVGVTGGKLLALTGSSGTALDRLVHETSAYYLATVDAQKNDRSGRSQELAIRVSRKGVEVRSQPHITFATPRNSEKISTPSLRDMLTTLRAFRDLPLRAAGFPALASEGENIRVVALAEPVDPDAKLESAAAALFNQDGKLAAQWIATPEDLGRRPVMAAMSVPPGAYRLRVAAIDSTGRSGAADYDVTAEIVRSGPLQLSSLVLGLSRAGGFSPRLQFTTEPLAIAYLELAGAPTGARVMAALEVSESMNGPALVSVPLAIEGTAENRYRATGAVPLGALPAGDYIVRAMVGLEGHPMTRVVRTIRKAVPAVK